MKRNIYDGDIPCLKKIQHQVKGFERITNKQAPGVYDNILWCKAIKHAAENKLKELGVEDFE